MADGVTGCVVHAATAGTAAPPLPSQAAALAAASGQTAQTTSPGYGVLGGGGVAMQDVDAVARDAVARDAVARDAVARASGTGDDASDPDAESLTTEDDEEEEEEEDDDDDRDDDMFCDENAGCGMRERCCAQRFLAGNLLKQAILFYCYQRGGGGAGRVA